MPPQGQTLSPAKALNTQLWAENPVYRQVLGICSALAVTNLVLNTLLMCVGLIWATAMSSLTVSLIRNYIPQRVRMIIQVLVISVYVIMVDIALRVWFPEVHKEIAAYVGLIITNCIVMGRLEAFAMKNRPWVSLMDGVGSGLGYSLLLLLVALPREIMGFGSVMGYKLPALEAWWHQWTIMVTPPGAFFVLALAVWYFRGREARKAASAQGGK